MVNTHVPSNGTDEVITKLADDISVTDTNGNILTDVTFAVDEGGEVRVSFKNVEGAGSLDDLVTWASQNELSSLTRTELDDIFKFVDNNFDFAKRVANSTKEIQSAFTLTELAGKLNLPIIPSAKSLTPYQARVWYNWRKSKILI